MRPVSDGEYARMEELLNKTMQELDVLTAVLAMF
jgi:hypothetical protein